jgi:hypothetical protein
MDMATRAREGGFEIGPPVALNCRKAQKRYYFRRNKPKKSFRINKSLKKQTQKGPEIARKMPYEEQKKKGKCSLISPFNKKCRFP